MARGGAVIAATLAAWLGLGVAVAHALAPPTGWDGRNPFRCELQQAGFGTKVPHPEADPYCVEFDKRRQNLTQLGVVDFLLREPARVAAAVPKCFYFQSDHWRGSVIQDNGATKTYEWDGHYFFDKARAEGGVWVTNFNINGKTYDPSRLPGMPPEYARFFGPGTGGLRTRNSLPGDPACAAKAARDGSRIYALRARPGCVRPGGPVTRRRLGPLSIGDTESRVRGTIGAPHQVKRGFLRYCVTGGGRFLVGEREDRSGELGEGADERAVMLLASARAFRYRGVGPGTRLGGLLRALPRARRALRYGHTTVYLARAGSSVLFGVRGRRVRFVAVRDAGLVRGRRGLRTFLSRAR